MKTRNKIILGSVGGVLVLGGIGGALSGGGDSSKPAPKPAAVKHSPDAQEKAWAANAKTHSFNKEHTPAKDVDYVRLNDKTDTSDPTFILDDVQVDYKLTNHSSKASDYTVQWEVVRKDGVRIANDTEYQYNVAPGQSVVGNDGLTVITHAQLKAGAKLKVTAVDRTETY